MHSAGCRTGRGGCSTSAEITVHASPVAQPTRRSEQLTPPGDCLPHPGSTRGRFQTCVAKPADILSFGCAHSPAYAQFASGTSDMDGRTARMEKVKAGDTGFDLVIFSQQVLDKAITARLSFA